VLEAFEIHEFHWNVLWQRVDDQSMGREFIKSPVPMEETTLANPLRRFLGRIIKMHMVGVPFVNADMIVCWIGPGIP